MTVRQRHRAVRRSLAAVLIAGCLSPAISALDAKPAANPVATAVALGKPRVASINLCADQLVLLLADHDQIVSLSNLSIDKAGSYFFKKAAAYPLNSGHAEQMLALQPDIIIAGTYSPRHTVRLLTETGLRVETLPIADSIESVISNIEAVAQWLGQADKAKRIVSDIRQRLADLDSSGSTVKSSSALQPRETPMAAVFDPNGYTVGRQSLRGRMIELAGWENAASRLGIESYGSMSLEALIALQPDALIESPYSPGTYSRAQVLAAHPALRSAAVAPLTITIPSRRTICAGPWTLGVVEQLQQARRALQQGSPAQPVDLPSGTGREAVTTSQKPAPGYQP